MAGQVEIELDNGEILDPLSDDASSSTDPTILLREGNQEHDIITTCFLSGLSATLANATTIITIHKKSPNAITMRAKSLAFRIFTEAMARKNGGDPNFKYGWYAGYREQIERIVTYGFSSSEMRSMMIRLMESDELSACQTKLGIRRDTCEYDLAI